MIFLSTVLAPLMRRANIPVEQVALFRSAARRFRLIVWLSILSLLMTGPVLLHAKNIRLSVPTDWPAVLRIKLGLAPAADDRTRSIPGTSLQGIRRHSCSGQDAARAKTHGEWPLARSPVPHHRDGDSGGCCGSRKVVRRPAPKSPMLTVEDGVGARPTRPAFGVSPLVLLHYHLLSSPSCTANRGQSLRTGIRMSCRIHR